MFNVIKKYSHNHKNDQLPYTMKRAGYVACRATQPVASFVASTGYATSCRLCSQCE